MQQCVDGVVTPYLLDLEGGLTLMSADGSYANLHRNERIGQVRFNKADYFLGDALESGVKLLMSEPRRTS